MEFRAGTLIRPISRTLLKFEALADRISQPMKAGYDMRSAGRAPVGKN